MSTPATPGTAIAKSAPILPPWAEEVLRPYLGSTEFELILPAMPMSGALPSALMPSISIVRIDPDPANGDVYPVGRKNVDGQWVNVLAYAKPALERLASAAGVQLRTRRTDDMRDPDLCAFEAVGAMLNSTGDQVMRSASAAIRLTQWSEDRWTEILAANEKYPDKKKDEPKLRADWRAEMAQFRKHFASRVETKAALRVIRQLLAIKSQLTAAQVARPKVLARISPNLNDPEVRSAMLTRGLFAGALLYGPEPSRAEVVEEPRRALPAADGGGDDERAEALAAIERPAAAAEQSAEALFAEGCDVLGLDLHERAKILTAAAGDWAKANAALNEIGNRQTGS